MKPEWVGILPDSSFIIAKQGLMSIAVSFKRGPTSKKLANLSAGRQARYKQDTRNIHEVEAPLHNQAIIND